MNAISKLRIHQQDILLGKDVTVNITNVIRGEKIPCVSIYNRFLIPFIVYLNLKRQEWKYLLQRWTKHNTLGILGKHTIEWSSLIMLGL